MQEEITKACRFHCHFYWRTSIHWNKFNLYWRKRRFKKKYLPQLTSGEKIAAFALTESEAGSDSFNLKTSAKLKGDKWILNGTKVWITNAGIADVFSVFARTEKGITGFVVEKDFPGVFVGPPEKKLGIKGSITNSITFEDVEVPDENIIGDDGRGFLIAMAALDAGRLGLGAGCLGASKELLEVSTKYSKQRKQFGEADFKISSNSIYAC